MLVGHGSKFVLVVGSVNVDLYQKMSDSNVAFGTRRVDMQHIKGQTLPARSFVTHERTALQGLTCLPGEEEELVLSMEGPFQQKTGGKGANAAAAAASTFACELVCNFGRSSTKENEMLISDLEKYGQVGTSLCGLVDGPTGTAYILLFTQDNDNCILLLGGANQCWPEKPAGPGSSISRGLSEACAVMLQREIPPHVNVAVASSACAANVPVVMDVGGSDARLDNALLPYVTVIAPNESELSFISGMPTVDDTNGEVRIDLLRKAVATLKEEFAAAGNTCVEVLVTVGSQGAIHFGSLWTCQDTPAGLHETSAGTYKLSTEDGKPRDTTGAGDCFRGSYVAARYGLGKSVRDSMVWASAAGSLAVEVEGAMPSMPTKQMIEERLGGSRSPSVFD